MKKVLATLFCVSLLGMPMLAQSADKAPAGCCAQKQVSQKAKGECCKMKESAKKDCCAKEKVSQKACETCEKTAQTWMTPPAKCVKGCSKTAAR